jgi:hypothetical protein
MDSTAPGAGEEAARLTIENQRLREVAAGQGSPDETERIRGELASARLEADALREQQVAIQRDLLIAAQAEAFIDLDTVQKLTRSSLKHTGNGFIVINDDGSPRVNPDSTPMSVAEFFSDFANKKPWLARGVVKSGSGSLPSTGRIPSIDRHTPETLWGPNARPDAGRILNALALHDKSAYDAARRSAVQKGLI